MTDPLHRFPPDTPAEAWHAPAGDNDLPCIWPIGAGPLGEVLAKVRKLPAAEHRDIYITVNGNRDIHGAIWPYYPLGKIKLAE